MARESLAPAYGRAIWIRVGAVTFALLVVPILAWILLAKSREPAPTSPSSRALVADTRPHSSTEPIAGARGITGKVVDENGAGVAGVSVTFSQTTGTATSSLRVTSDEEGAFFLDNLPEAAGSLSAKKTGYAGSPSAVEAGSNDISGVTLSIHKSRGVKGQVVDGDGKGVDHAIVKCDGDKSIMATTQPDGTFELPVDEAGCNAVASHPDYGASDPSHLRSGSRNILELPSPGGIAGVVVDEQGKPVAAYLIAMESFVPADKEVDALGGISQNVNDAGGAFELTGLARGKYVLTASAPGRPPQRSDSIEVTSGRTTRGVRIALTRGLVLSGTVIDRTTKKPIAGARVALDAVTSTGANAVPPVATDDSGSYTMDGAPSGTFSLRVSAPDYRERIVSLDGHGKSQLHADVDLAPASGDSTTELTGIGATLGQGPGFVLIGSVISGGPAEKSGVKARDHIAKIDGQSAEGFSISDCINRLRGPEGTMVVLTVDRDGSQVDIPIKREVIVR